MEEDTSFDSSSNTQPATKRIYLVVTDGQENLNENLTQLLDQALMLLKESKAKVAKLHVQKILSLPHKFLDFSFIIPEFEGVFYEHLRNIGARIYGPLAIIQAMTRVGKIPKAPYPLLALTLLGYNITVTGLDFYERAFLFDEIKLLGGIASGSMKAETTHLIAKYCDPASDKYKQAIITNIPVVSPEWIEFVYGSAKDGSFLLSNGDGIEEFIVPVFAGCDTCASGFDGDIRLQISQIRHFSALTTTKEMEEDPSFDSTIGCNTQPTTKMIYLVVTDGQENLNDDLTQLLDQAFMILKESKAKVANIHLQKVLSLPQKFPGFYFIIPEFEGVLYEHLRNIGARIYGPLAIIQALTGIGKIPKAPYPLLALTLLGYNITVTGLDSDERPFLFDKIEQLGGISSGSMKAETTHLIARYCDSSSDKYKQALKTNIPVVSPDWIEFLYGSAKDGSFLITNSDRIDDFIVPIFSGCHMSASGVSEATRFEISEIAVNNGGAFYRNMDRFTCTHLIINSNTGEKYRKALQWGTVRIVTMKWLTKCCELKKRLPEKYFFPCQKTSTQIENNVTLNDPGVSALFTSSRSPQENSTASMLSSTRHFVPTPGLPAEAQIVPSNFVEKRNSESEPLAEIVKEPEDQPLAAIYGAEIEHSNVEEMDFENEPLFEDEIEQEPEDLEMSTEVTAAKKLPFILPPDLLKRCQAMSSSSATNNLSPRHDSIPLQTQRSAPNLLNETISLSSDVEESQNNVQAEVSWEGQYSTQDMLRFNQKGAKSPLFSHVQNQTLSEMDTDSADPFLMFSKENFLQRITSNVPKGVVSEIHRPIMPSVEIISQNVNVSQPDTDVQIIED